MFLRYALLICIWSSLPINYVETLNRDDTIQLFNQLINSLRGKINAPSQRNQYAIPYIPPDLNAAVSRNPNFVPALEYRNVRLNQYPQQRITDGVASNYLITVPQKIGDMKVHTEVLLLADNHKLYSGMQHHLRRNANTNPSEIYLYSFNQPCFYCSGAISRFVYKLRDTQTKFIVGFTTDGWNQDTEGENKAAEGLQRLIDNLCTGQHRLVVVPKQNYGFSKAAPDGQIMSGRRKCFPN